VTGTNFIKYISVFLLAIFSFAAHAQDTVDIKTLKAGQSKRFGKNAVKQGDYYAATEYFSHFMKLKPNNTKVAFKLAESFRASRDYVSAQEWYSKAYKLSGENDPLSCYYYALMLKMNGNCDKAKEQFIKFKKQAGGKSSLAELKKQVKNEITGCDSIVPFSKLVSKISVTHLDTSINKIHVEHSPVMLDSNTLLYSSVRTDKKVYTVTTQLDTTVGAWKKFYTARKENNKWVYNGEFDPMFNKEGFNNGNGTFSADAKRFYFTRCKKNWKNQMICGIYVSSKGDNGEWTEPIALNSKINNPKYTSTQPAVSIESVKQNEVVYFVSNRPGGKGGLDIWFFIYDFKKKTYSEPKNAGNKINTTSDEMTPFYDQDNRVLFFSSNGWAGLGGLDVFKSSGEMKKFLPPENIGAPANSTNDDLYYVKGKSNEDGFFVSNRKGGTATKKNPTCCDDIYSYKLLQYVKLNAQGTVTDEKGNPVANTKVSLYSTEGDADPVFIKSVETDSRGNYDLGLQTGNNYKLAFEKEKYLNTNHDFTTKDISQSQNISHNATIKEITEKAYVLSHVLYANDMYELLEQSKKDIDTTLLLFLNENPDMIVEISSHTDNQASDSYNNKLSQKRAEGVTKYLISKGIKPERLQSHGYGETRPVADNKTEEGRALNRRTEFKILGKLAKKEKEYDDKE
jgi:OOP family OmpA-OmpF porin